MDWSNLPVEIVGGIIGAALGSALGTLFGVFIAALLLRHKLPGPTTRGSGEAMLLALPLLLARAATARQGEEEWLKRVMDKAGVSKLFPSLVEWLYHTAIASTIGMLAVFLFLLSPFINERSLRAFQLLSVLLSSFSTIFFVVSVRNMWSAKRILKKTAEELHKEITTSSPNANTSQTSDPVNTSTINASTSPAGAAPTAASTHIINTAQAPTLGSTDNSPSSNVSSQTVTPGGA